MRYVIVILFLVICFASCKTHTTQYYKSGIEIHPKLSVIAADSSNINELRIVNKNPHYTIRISFDNFGLWSKTIAPLDTYAYYFAWEKIQLFEDSPERYTIITSGTDLYSSAWIFDMENKDCLADSSSIKTKIIDFFAKGINQVKLEADDTYYSARSHAMNNTVRK